MNATSTAFQEVPIGKVKPDPDQPRKTIGEAAFAALVESVKTHGILTPLRLRPNGSGYVIVAGERRWRAAKEAKLKTVPAVVVETGAARVEALVENLQREDLNPVEEGDAYTALFDGGMSVEAIAMSVSRPEDRVRDRLAIARLPGPAREALVAGRATLPDVRAYVALADASPELAYALTFAADRINHWNRDPWAVFFDLDRVDPSVTVTACAECDGDGYIEESDENCSKCGGTGEITTENKDAEGWPLFFAFALWHSTPLLERMVAQLPDEARGRIEAAMQKAAAVYEDRKKKAKHFYVNAAPSPSLDSQELRDAARAAGVAVEFGHNRSVVIDPAFVAEYLPEAYDRDVEDYISGGRTGRASKPKAGKGQQLSTAEQRAKDDRAKEREKATRQRAEARAFNARLGIAIQTKLGEVPVTTEAMKLLVQTVLDQTKREQSYSPGKLGGDGHSMFQRFTRVDWPATKAGDYKVPRSAEDRAKFAAAVFKQAEKELAAAKTPPQALGVLVRFLAHGLVDLRGLPNADLQGMFGYRTQATAWRRFVMARLPKALRDKVPAENGIKGKSFGW